MFILRLKQTIRDYGLVNRDDTVLVAVSGGPDSVALLSSLHSLRKSLKIDLYIAHLDHMLRKDSRKDREFVLDLAKKFKLPVVIGGVDIAKLAEEGSIEEIARNKRQEFLFNVAKRYKINKIALGHNRDDQAETVLMRIIRGSGLYGLNAILPKRRIGGFTIIRPLIETPRKEIEAYLKKRNIKARVDKSNLENFYFRNRIRNKLLPQLEKGFNPNIKGVLANLAYSAALDYEYLANQANKAFKQVHKSGDRNQVRLYLTKINKLHPAMMKLVLRLAYAKIKGNLRRLTFKHLKEIEDLLCNRPFNSIVDLPSNISVIKKQGFLIFYYKR